MILTLEQIHAIFAIDYIRWCYQPAQRLPVRPSQLSEGTSIDRKFSKHTAYFHDVRSYLRPEAFLEI